LYKAVEFAILFANQTALFYSDLLNAKSAVKNTWMGSVITSSTNANGVRTVAATTSSTLAESFLSPYFFVFCLNINYLLQ